MNELNLMEKKELKGGDNLKKILNKRLLKNNKGFSLVELLIVIAIMGVLAVIAFNMFGGVLNNSKKRADDATAETIKKAILTYCLDSGDWDLNGAYTDATHTTAADLAGSTGIQVITTLMKPVYDNTGKEYGPYFSPKDPTASVTAPVNQNAYMPQWSEANTPGGTYTGWQITVYVKAQSVDVKPTSAATVPDCSIDTTTTVH